MLNSKISALYKMTSEIANLNGSFVVYVFFTKIE